MKSILCICILALSYLPTHAQQEDTAIVSQTIQQLNNFWNRFNYPAPVFDDTSGFTQLNSLFSYHPTITQNNRVLNDQILLNELKAGQYKKDWGLELNAGYSENFNPNFSDDDNLIYNRRIQSGVSWDILNSGFVENRKLSKAALLQNMLMEQTLSVSGGQEVFTARWNRIIFAFNKEKVRLLDLRLQLLRAQNAAASKLFHTKYISKESMLESDKRLAEISSMYDIYKTYNEQLQILNTDTVLNITHFPLIDIRYEKVFETQYNQETPHDSIYQIMMAKSALENDFLNEVSLNAYLRYNYYDLVIANPANRAFMSAGLNLSVPLFFGGKTRKQYNEVKARLEHDKMLSSARNEEKDLLNDCYEYRYKLKQYISFYQKKLIFEEILRQENARKKIDPVSFNPYKAISLKDDILSIELELTDLQQNMYLKLLRIASRMNNYNYRSYSTAIMLPDRITLYNDLEYHAYMWSSTMDEYDTSFISEYARYLGFEKIAISFSDDAGKKNKALGLCKSWKAMGIQTEVLIGDNHLHNKNITEVFNTVLPGDKSLVNGIHLDYEPHTLHDWDSRKKQYLEDFTALLKQAREYCNKHKLTLNISIPLHYPAEMVNGFFEICDQVTFMAYENVNLSHISGKLSPYEKFKNKTCVALRTNDFTDRNAMEQKIKEISSATGIREFYLHDMKRIIAWDEGVLEKK